MKGRPFPKRRATIPAIPDAPAVEAPETREERAARWEADMAKRRSLMAGAANYDAALQALVDAGELSPNTAAMIRRPA